MKGEGEGLLLRNGIIGNSRKLDSVTTRMAGPDLKGLTVEYEHYADPVSGQHALVHQTAKMINLVLLDSSKIQPGEALPSINDLPEELIKKVQ